MAEKHIILDYLPHRPPFLMVDKLTSVEENRFESEFYIPADNILLAGGEFLESGLIENIAQTCAAGFGYLGAQKGEQPKVGYIGSVTKVDVFHLPPIGATIITIVEPLHQLGNIVLVRGANYWNEAKLVDCEMKIVISE